MSPRRPTIPKTRKEYSKLADAPRPTEARVSAILGTLEKLYPSVTTALRHHDPFQLLIATILSAQCTDEVVNQVTRRLFTHFPDAASLSHASPLEVETLIRSTGFFRNKARNIIAAARRVHEHYGGEVPGEMDELLTLPGVARKTANVVMGSAFGAAEGVVVDTHVKRVTRRWRFHGVKDPVRIERCLMAIIPRARWVSFSHQTIWHGRKLCPARRPRCGQCPLPPHCPEGQTLLPMHQGSQ